jgi:2'-5' RNA ligase
VGGLRRDGQRADEVRRSQTAATFERAARGAAEWDGEGPPSLPWEVVGQRGVRGRLGRWACRRGFRLVGWGMGEASRLGGDPFLRERYEVLWGESIERIRSGNVGIDLVLARGEEDRRRGMTLLFWPAPEVQQRVGAFLDELREVDSDQRYYEAGEMHVTFLSLFTATVEHEALFARTPEYVAAVGSWVRGLAPFSVSFAGVTASPGAVMVQGFLDAQVLNEGRDELRRVLRARGLGDGVDLRYRLETAHMTAVRFRAPLRDGRRLARILERGRDLEFGEMEVRELELVRSDWYMSRGCTEGLGRFPLGG